MQLFSSFKDLFKKLKKEIIKDYKDCVRTALLNYILLDANERSRLNIQTMPVAFPVLTIRAPVPWQPSKLIAQHSINYNLFIGNEILRDIRDLWFSRYQFVYSIYFAVFFFFNSTMISNRWIFSYKTIFVSISIL